MFSKKDRSTFKYWFAHWCAYQMTALNLKVWRPKYLLHDIEKPWLKLFLPYDKVKQFHRKHADHHPALLTEKQKKMDWMATVIDWECSRFTKAEAPMTARETLDYVIRNKADKYDVDNIKKNMLPIINKLGI